MNGSAAYSSRALVGANEWEQHVLNEVLNGKFAELRVLSDGSRAEISADFISSTLSRISNRHEPEVRSGFRLRGARISGKLNLKDWSGPQDTALPALIFENCIFKDDIDISHAFLSRFSVVKCQFVRIRAEGVHIADRFNFSESRSYSDINPMARIDAKGAKIDGSVIGDEASLVSGYDQLKASNNQGVSVYDSEFSLDLSDALIAGGVFLSKSFTSKGGVDFSGSQIKGNLVLDSSDITASIQTALSIQNANIDGAVFLQKSKLRGLVCLRNAQMISVSCENSDFEAILDRRQRSLSDSQAGLALQNIAIDATSVRIARDLILAGKLFKVSGYISLLGSHIAGRVDCSDGVFFNKIHGKFSDSISFVNAEIGGDLILAKSKITGMIKLWGTKIGQDAIFEDSTIIGTEDSGDPKELSITALCGEHLQVRGGISLPQVQMYGDIYLPHLQVGGSFEVSDLNVLLVYKVKIDKSSVGFARYVPELNFSHSVIGAKFHLESINVTDDDSKSNTLNKRKKICVNLEYAKCTTFAYTWPVGFGGKTAFAFTEGNRKFELQLDGFFYQRLRRNNANSVTEMNGVYAESFRSFIQRTFCNVLLVFFGGLRPLVEYVNSLFKDRYSHRVLACSKVIMKRIYENKSQTPQEQCLQLLQMQSQAFTPQPYKHMAMVLFEQGEEDLSRHVLREVYKKTPALLWFRLFKPFWGGLFGYGMGPFRSMCTCIVWFCIGVFLIRYMVAHEVLIMTVTPSADVNISSFFLNTLNHTVVIPQHACKNVVSSPIYTADLMIPGGAFHQDLLCDIRPELRWWRYGKFLFAIIGKLFVAISLLTVSGILRRRVSSQ